MVSVVTYIKQIDKGKTVTFQGIYWTVGANQRYLPTHVHRYNDDAILYEYTADHHIMCTADYPVFC